MFVAALVVVATPSNASAADGCETVDYQGAPVDVCPVPIPDPTNCYTGQYQGAPVEVCMPTGATLPEGSTIDGEPVVIHVAAEYVPPSDPPATTVAPAPAPVPVVVDVVRPRVFPVVFLEANGVI